MKRKDSGKAANVVKALFLQKSYIILCKHGLIRKTIQIYIKLQ